MSIPPDPSAAADSTADPLPWTTPADLRCGGTLKQEPDDFEVEELPAYEPSGTGDHLFLWIQKRDLSAESLLDHLSRHLQVPRTEIGMAGLKDRRAVTRQWVSVPASVASRLPDVDCDSVQILRSTRHPHKLKTGHLRGNRFRIRIGGPHAGALAVAEDLAERIRTQGVANFFGDQRFGSGGQTLALGLSLINGTARPQSIPFKRRKFLLRLSLSAVQSALFNEVLRLRLQEGRLHRVEVGDVLQVTASGGLFLAEQEQVEQLRLDRREIGLTGPLFGPKMKSPTGTPQELEQAVLQSRGLTLEQFNAFKKLTPGGRRPLLLFPEGLTVSEHATNLQLEFSLPSGAYATVVMREFLKD